VSEEKSISTPTDHISLKRLFSLRQDESAEWGEVRAAQQADAARNVKWRISGALTLIALACFMLKESAPLWQLGLWALCGVGLMAERWKSYSRYNNLNLKTLPMSVVRADTAASISLAVMWGFAMLWFAPMAGPGVGLTLGAMIASVILAYVVLLPSAPASTCSFTVVSGFSVLGYAYLTDNYVLMGVAAAFAFLAVRGSIDGARDFIRFKSIQTSLVETNETVSLLLREFEDSGADWLWQIDSSRRLVQVSPRFARAVGKEPADLEGQPLLQVLAGEAWESGKFDQRLHELADKLNRRESFANLTLPVMIGTTQHFWEISASPRLDEKGKFLGFRGVGSDVTQQQTYSAKIDKMARFDGLTGLPNRLQINDTLSEAMKEAIKWNRRCALMLIDLDRFKAVNDTLGHPVGDRLLAQVSARLKSLMNSHSLCGRLGGDEFAVVVRDVMDANALDMLATQIITSLTRPFEVDGHTLFVGASIGSAMGPRDGKTVETITRNADLALYRSKDKGGNVHFAYEPALHAQAEERRVMEIALRKALQNGEFHLNYQPVVSAQDGSIEGFEALLRWNSPELGMVSPAKFIPVAEDCRQIAAIGEWVLRTACKEAASWPSNVRIAVNVSAEQLGEANFVSTVVSALSHSGLPASRLELEVTESVFLRDGGTMSKALDQLLGLGIRLSLDDFGTGYSSLGYLRKTRFNTIKVDRSFVQGAARQVPESVAIIRAVVAMAQSLGMSTTAEGAETEAEVEMIRSLGCTKIQGYYYGRPMSQSDVHALFDRLNQQSHVA
jgi:diguanylate cyclase (GGDEF)-like protein/PAS domain S-box-containing protein